MLDPLITTVDRICISIKNNRNNGGDYVDEAMKQIRLHKNELSHSDVNILIKKLQSDPRIIRVIIGSGILNPDQVLDILKEFKFDLTLCEAAVTHCKNEKVDEDFFVKLITIIHKRSRVTAAKICLMVKKYLSNDNRIIIEFNTNSDPNISRALG